MPLPAILFHSFSSPPFRLFLPNPAQHLLPQRRWREHPFPFRQESPFHESRGNLCGLKPAKDSGDSPLSTPYNSIVIGRCRCPFQFPRTIRRRLAVRKRGRHFLFARRRSGRARSRGGATDGAGSLLLSPRPRRFCQVASCAG